MIYANNVVIVEKYFCVGLGLRSLAVDDNFESILMIFLSGRYEERGGSFSQLLLCITSACKRDLFSSGDLLLDIICVHFCKNVLSIILDSNLVMKSVPTQLN